MCTIITKISFFEIKIFTNQIKSEKSKLMRNCRGFKKVTKFEWNIDPYWTDLD